MDEFIDVPQQIREQLIQDYTKHGLDFLQFELLKSYTKLKKTQGILMVLEMFDNVKQQSSFRKQINNKTQVNY